MYNNEHETHGQGGFITGLLCGAAVGAALGVVLAPRSGAATRQQLAESGGRLRQKVSQGYAKASEGVSQGYAKASEGVSSVVARGSEALEEGRDAFEKARQASTDQSGFGSLGPDYPSSRGI